MDEARQIVGRVHGGQEAAQGEEGCEEIQGCADREEARDIVENKEGLMGATAPGVRGRRGGTPGPRARQTRIQASALSISSDLKRSTPLTNVRLPGLTFVLVWTREQILADAVRESFF